MILYQYSVYIKKVVKKVDRCYQLYILIPQCWFHIVRHKSRAIHFFEFVSRVERDTQIARFMWPTWAPTGSCRPQVGPMNLAIRVGNYGSNDADKAPPSNLNERFHLITLLWEIPSQSAELSLKRVGFLSCGWPRLYSNLRSKICTFFTVLKVYTDWDFSPS